MANSDANANRDWIVVEWIANVPIERLEDLLQQDDAALSQRFSYLLLADGSVRRSAPPKPGVPVEILALRKGETAGEEQLESLKALGAYIAKWNANPAKAVEPDLKWVGVPGGGPVPAPIETKSAKRSARAMPLAPAAPAWPAFTDPGPFTGSPQQLRELGLHVINLRKGRLSDDGIMATDEQDLDAIVEAVVAHSRQGYRLMLYAHGGLTDERNGLAAAWAYHRWWLAHGIYPVYFVWETGGLETFWQIVEGEQRRGRGVSRDIWDYTTDPAIELIGGKVGTLQWSAMKDSAERASDKDGGARMFAEKLGKAWTSPTEIFAVGHSAGSIFHSHFLPVLCSGALRVEQMHLLAPAVTNALFAAKLAPMVGTKIKSGTVFAMTRQAERADNCAGVYHKSLLYLVSRAFEPKQETPILGMEDFHRSDPMVGRVFGENIILSPTPATVKPTRASGSSSHGGFDNDVLTIENLVRRMRRLPDDVIVTPPFPPGEPRIGRAAVEPNFYGVPSGLFRGAELPPVQADAAAPVFVSAPVAVPVPAPAGGTGPAIGLGGQKIALCIGNNGFPGGMELYGCINDAKVWADTFRQQGYAATVLTDARAGQIRDAIRSILSRARRGDSVMIHISSHGSRVLDVDGDELQDKQYADTKDEALVALDWQEGGLIIDDEWPGLMKVAEGVKLIRFHDFCHSGRSSRMALNDANRRRKRSISLTDEIARKAYASASLRGARAAPEFGTDLDYVTFCACLPDQSAMEEGGSGVFTRAATKILRGQGSTFSAQDAFAAIAREMANEEQKPLLEGSSLYSAMPLFALPS